ncbi:MAG: DNA adenine methylase [Firmicutes bacterium]|nr:DNA adenine methylase [Bacillota bacterium]
MEQAGTWPGLSGPVIKWAGGKRQLLFQFHSLFPARFRGAYHEPFFGSGAVFFHLSPPRAYLTDNNQELINFYQVLQTEAGRLIDDLKKHVNTREYYYQVRALDPASLTPVERASRFLYLNKCGYNGLWRVNRQGRHNVPFGAYKNPRFLDPPALYAASRALKGAFLQAADFEIALEQARPGDFIYCDPPYHPLSATAHFRSYTAESFSARDQERLAAMFGELDRRGCLVMASNSDTPFIRGLYAGYNITTVTARRAINCKGDGRGPINELVIRNY